MEMSKEEQEFHRKADAEIEMMDKISAWCYGNDGNLNHADEVIAKNVEEEFGIPAALVMAEFRAEDAPNFSTYDQIINAWKKHTQQS